MEWMSRLWNFDVGIEDTSVAPNTVEQPPGTATMGSPQAVYVQYNLSVIRKWQRTEKKFFYGAKCVYPEQCWKLFVAQFKCILSLTIHLK